MELKKRFSKSKCPHCEEYTITYSQKMKLADYRFSHSCKKCEGTLKFPAWHALLLISENLLYLFLILKFKLNTFQIVLLGVVVYLIIMFIQLPNIKVKG